MKTLNTIVKIVTALAAVAGIVYIVATYGEQIVAWAKKVLAALPCPCCKDAEPVEETVEEPAAEEAPAAEEPIVDEPAPEVVVEETPEVAVADNEPVAEDSDFAE